MKGIISQIVPEILAGLTISLILYIAARIRQVYRLAQTHDRTLYGEQNNPNDDGILSKINEHEGRIKALEKQE